MIRLINATVPFAMMRFLTLAFNYIIHLAHRNNITYPQQTLIIPNPDIAQLVVHSIIYQILLVFFNALTGDFVSTHHLHAILATQLLKTPLLQSLFCGHFLHSLFRGHVLMLVFKKGEFVIVFHRCHQLTVLPYPTADTLLVNKILPPASDIAVVKLANILLTRLEKQVPLAMFFKILHLSIIHISRRVLDLHLAQQLVRRPLP
jgi:hypothetical protein